MAAAQKLFVGSRIYGLAQDCLGQGCRVSCGAATLLRQAAGSKAAQLAGVAPHPRHTRCTTPSRRRARPLPFSARPCLVLSCDLSPHLAGCAPWSLRERVELRERVYSQPEELKCTRDAWQDKITEALQYGVIKFNIDTDIQVTVVCVVSARHLRRACRQRAGVTWRFAACFAGLARAFRALDEAALLCQRMWLVVEACCRVARRGWRE